MDLFLGNYKIMSPDLEESALALENQRRGRLLAVSI